MKPRFDGGFHLAYVGLLRCAALMVPRPERAEWFREWRGELWQADRACPRQRRIDLEAESQVLSFCLGAFKDAFCLRRESAAPRVPQPNLHGSALLCLITMAGLVVAAYTFSLLLPGVRRMTQLVHQQVNPGLIVIQGDPRGGVRTANIRAGAYRDWQAHFQKYFDNMAFYRVGEERLQTGSGSDVQMVVAHATSNLFLILGLPVTSDDEQPSTLPSVILSERTWRTQFDSSPFLIDRVVRIGGVSARIAGVAPEGAWHLPGNPAAWILESGEKASGNGYVVAHLTAEGQAEMISGCVHISSYKDNGADEDLWGYTFSERTMEPQRIYLFMLVLALLALPAVTSVSLGEYNFDAPRLNLRKKLARSAFLAAKFAALLPLAYFASLDLAYGVITHHPIASEYIQLISAFALLLFGMRWVLLDQRQRCPVCLRRVTHPARVGLASRTFLAWNGTELMCMGGHTLLHVPSLPTSWFSNPRWLYLDKSWDFLFAEPV